MDAERISIAEGCLRAAHDGSASFPAILAALGAAGFEGYLVDYRADTQTYHLADGGSVPLDAPPSSGAIAATFDAAQVQAMIRWAQSGDADYNYPAFSAKVKAAGCAGYIVSLSGRRVVYFGRTGELHVEHFPD